MWNYEQRPFDIPDAGDVFREVIAAGSTVTLIGPSDGPWRDPSPLLVGHLVGPCGKVYIADPNENYINPLRISLGGPDVQCGSVTQFLKCIEAFKEAGFPLPEYAWLGPDSGIFHIPEEADVLVDHGTAQYVLQVKPDLRDPLDRSISTIAQTYWNALRPGGTLLWQVNSTTALGWGLSMKDFIGFFQNALNSVGFDAIQHLEVEDVYRIPVPEDSVERIRAIRAFLGGTIYDNERFLVNGCLLFDSPHHNCPDMFVARK